MGMRARQTILVVDDQPAALYAASRVLKKAGYQTIEATNGEDAIRLAKSAHAMLVDVNLPDVNGVEVCHLVKSGKVGPVIPVVLMSAVYVDELHQGAAMSSGADGYLLMPLEEQPLLATFDKLLGTA